MRPTLEKRSLRPHPYPIVGVVNATQLRSLALLLAIVSFPACQTALVCREPYVDSFTAEGVPDALCDMMFDQCEDGSLIGVSCSIAFNDEYHCTWYRSVDLRYDTGEFDSPDFCIADMDSMIEQLDRLGHLDIRIE